MGDDRLDKILICLGELKGQMESVLSNHLHIDKRLDSHDTRLKSLENAQAWIKGAGTVSGALGGVLGAIMTLIAQFFIHH